MTPVANISDTDQATTHGESNSSYDSDFLQGIPLGSTAMYHHYPPQVHSFTE